MTRRLAQAVVALLTLALLAAATVTTTAAAERSLVPASKVTAKPFRSIALVAVGDGVVCTGFIIGQRKVATAAHCLTRNASGGDYRLKKRLPGSIRILRGYSRAAGGVNFPTCGVARVWAHKKFVRRNSRDRQFGSRAHDYAVLTTKADCRYPKNAVMKLWASKPFDGKLLTGQKTRMAGYPADPRFSGTNGLNMWRTEGNLQPAGSDPRLINTTGFVAQGMSGAPIWRSFKRGSPCGRQQCVIAILTECEVNRRGLCKTGDSDRRGVRITPTVKKLLRNR